MSRLWTSVIQTRYLLSTTCVAESVFIEGSRSGRDAASVRTEGESS
jgi:hypothetical protein